MTKLETVEIAVKHHSYQPSKDELNEDASIPTRPESLARAILRPVTVKEKNCDLSI